MTTLLIVGVYLLAMLVIGLWHRRPAGDAVLFVGGRSTGPVFLAGSMIATIFGAFGVMSVAGIALNIGMVAGWYHWVGTIGLLVLGFWALGRVALGDVYTLPEMLGRGYGGMVRRLSGCLIVLAWVSIIGAQFIAGGKIVQFLLAQAGISALESVPREIWGIACGILVTVYTMVGGQRSVIRTDLVQAFLIFFGVLALFVTLLLNDPSPLRSIPSDKFDFPFSADMPLSTWLKLLLTIGVPFLIGPDIYSRILSGRDLQTGRIAVFTSAAVMIPLVLMIVLCGMMGRVYFPDGLADRESVLLLLARDHTGPLVAGLMVAALLAAIMSSADTCLVTVSTIITRDILPGGGANGGASAIPTGRLLIAVAGAIAMLLASAYGSILSALYSAYQIYSPSVLLPFLALLLFREHRFKRNTGVLAMASGAGVAGLGMMLQVQWLQLASFAAPALPLAVDLLTKKKGGSPSLP